MSCDMCHTSPVTSCLSTEHHYMQLGEVWWFIEEEEKEEEKNCPKN